ncbi:MAG: peptidoglycan-associated lipoprotein Pal [Pseudomonadales bacterium]|nr:peptidoglycan-associated lipoprotein Pal [Pseudomonadales bacterium]
MQQQWLRNTLGLVLAGLILAGCAGQTKTNEPAQIPEESTQTEAPAPIENVEPPKTVDAMGNPLDPNTGNPLSRTFYFEFDRATLSASDLAALELHASFLRDNRDRSVLVEGHCDERGTREYNLALGERRGDTVVSFLTNSGVNRSQLEVVSYGEEKPVDAGHSEGAWHRNRRAELIYR